VNIRFARSLLVLLLFTLAACSKSGSDGQEIIPKEGGNGQEVVQSACPTVDMTECRDLGFVTCGDFNQDGVLEWGPLQSCPPGQSCSNGQCLIGCANECSAAGISECRPGGLVSCGNFDTDSCLEWSPLQSCPPGQTCSNGQCLIGCANECSAAGISECRSGGLVSCGNFDADSCLEWSPLQNCPAGQSCNNGQCAPTTNTIWRPAPGTSWQWQLSGTLDQTLAVHMYDIDLFDTPQTVINALQAQGKVVICYFSAGSREDWRPDANLFPQAAIGSPLDNWPGETWIDIRNQAVRDIMKARLDLARDKGCDGVEPDNVDGYSNQNGLGLSAAHQLDYNRFLAHEAHARGLSVGLKNDLDQVEELLNDFDWAMNESCFAFNECNRLLPFINAGKAVFHVEYGAAALATSICPRANSLNFDSLIKRSQLDAWRIPCR